MIESYDSMRAYQCKLYVAFVSPPGAPRVANNPISLINIHTDNIDSVIDIQSRPAICENAGLVCSPQCGVHDN